MPTQSKKEQVNFLRDHDKMDDLRQRARLAAVELKRTITVTDLINDALDQVYPPVGK